ncbi:MAG: cupin domain-containing protein, partial [Actinomycetota bacterium]|nr:cupin domain-containing protein [Actinomycetota bacterium]
EKRWLVYPPALELPLSDQRYSPELGEPGEPVQDVTLGPGDTLYLPRGWLHEALTSELDSLHLTIGVNVYTWLDAARAALEECGEELAFRRSVPEDGRTDSDLAGLLAERLAPEDVARRMRQRFLKSRRPIRDGQLAQLRGLDGLDVETPVRRRETVIAALQDEGNGLRLSFEGKDVVFPRLVREEVEFAFAAEDAFRPLDLPGELDDEGRLVLVRRLVREGFLRLVAP